MSYYKKEKKGHGCFGAIFAFGIIVIAILILLMFCTDKLDVYKYKAIGILYPQKYSEYVEKYSKEYDVDKELVYAVIKTESGFRPEVESTVGARGLMQLMPETFEWLQLSNDGAVVHSKDDLFDPEINIKYGTLCLSDLLGMYGGDEKTAIAAYNAGMTIVDEWLKDSRYSDNYISLKMIPYPETKEYVEKVLKNKEIYIKIYKGDK